VTIRLGERAGVQYRICLRVQTKERSNEDRDRDTAEERMPQEQGLVRRVQEPEYRAEKIMSLVYVVQNCVTNNCSSAS
jgi:hypothetical protein